MDWKSWIPKRLKFWAPTEEGLRRMADEFFVPGKKGIKVPSGLDGESWINFCRKKRLERYLKRYPSITISAILDVLRERFNRAAINNSNPEGSPLHHLLSLLHEHADVIPEEYIGQIARMLWWEEVVRDKEWGLGSTILMTLMRRKNALLTPIIEEHLALVRERGLNTYEDECGKKFIGIVLDLMRSSPPFYAKR